MSIATFDSNASLKLIDAEDVYYEHAGRHFEKGIWHTTYVAPDDINQRYQFHNMRLMNLIYSHFQSAADLNFKESKRILEAVPPSPHSHIMMLRDSVLFKIRANYNQFLPTMDSHEDPFKSERGANIKSGIVNFKNTNGPYHTATLMTIKTVNNGLSGKKTAAVCFSHLPGYSYGCSPMNAIEKLAEKLLVNELKEYNIDNVRFFVHVPPESAFISKEMLIEHELKIVNGRVKVIDRKEFDGKKPKYLDGVVFTHFDKPESLENRVSAWFNLSSEDAKKHGVSDEIELLKNNHAAQVNRRFILATQP